MYLSFLKQLSGNAIIQALCRTFIHSLWQGLLIAALAGIIIMRTKKSSALLRHNLLAALFFAFLLITGITFTIQLRQLDSSSNAQPSFSKQTITLIHHSPVSINVLTSQQSFPEKLEQCMNDNASLIVLVWALIFLAKCVKLIAGFYHIQGIRYYKTHKPANDWMIRLKVLCKYLGIKKHIALLQSEVVKIPLVIGFFKPVILVPFGLLANIPVDQVETVLLHELAHIRRKDYLINLIQNLIETFFFFNPGITWISSLIREEREACCDDIVIRHFPNSKSYLEALLYFEEYSLNGTNYAMTLGGKRMHLLDRVKRMVTRENKKLTGVEKMLLISGVLAITVFGFIYKKEEVMQKLHAATGQSAKPAVENADVTLKTASDKNFAKINGKKNYMIQVASVDTPPEKKSTLPKVNIPKSESGELPVDFTNISMSSNDNGENTTTIIEATDNNGKKYRIKKVENEIKEVSINGSPVSKEKIGDYEETAAFIEYVREMRIHDIPSEMQEQWLKTGRIAVHYSEEKKKVMQEKIDPEMLSKKLAALDEEAQEKIRAINEEGRIKAHKASQLISLDEQIKSILNDLMQDKVITKEEGVSFTLNNKELLINDKKQSDVVYQKLKEKYIRNAGDLFSYTHKDGTVQTTVHQE